MERKISDIIRKYSKSSSFYIKTKDDFFSQNNSFLKKALSDNELYASQNERKNCKLCNALLGQERDLTNHNVNYVFCRNCNHLNGKHEDTDAFVNSIYLEENGKDYSKNYISEDYMKRTQDVYTPKIDFLKDHFPTNLKKILDVGCGSGFFVLSALQSKIDVIGIDVNKSMIDFGNSSISKINGKKPLEYINEHDFYNYILNTDVDVISLIGVIEHLKNPHNLFESFKKSKCKYIFYSVPMFSFSVILENFFKNVFPRHLSGGHTHLFTEDSLKKMHSILGVEPIAEWRFGTDIMDLFRSTIYSLNENNCSEYVLNNFKDQFLHQIDDLQNTLDKNHFCSEIHVLAGKL